MNNKPRSTSTTGIKYLNVDHRKKFGHEYNVRVIISGKHFVVWRGNSFNKGAAIAKRVQKLMAKGKETFLDWYDNNREDWLKEHGYTDANK